MLYFIDREIYLFFTEKGKPSVRMGHPDNSGIIISIYFGIPRNNARDKTKGPSADDYVVQGSQLPVGHCTYSSDEE